MSAPQGELFKSPSDYYVNTLPQCVSCFVLEQTGLDARGFIKQKEKGFNMETTHRPVWSLTETKKKNVGLQH